MIKNSFVRLLLVLAGLMAAFASPAYAVVQLTISKGNVAPLPIAITDFLSNGDVGAQISAVVAASAAFRPVAPIGSAPSSRRSPDAAPRFPDGRRSMLRRRHRPEPRGTAACAIPALGRFHATDTAAVPTQPENWRQLAHTSCPTIYQQITGERATSTAAWSSSRAARRLLTKPAAIMVRRLQQPGC